MGYTIAGLKDKILELYPEIEKHKLVSGLTFDAEKNAYILKLSGGGHELTTHLEKADADACIDGRKCIALGVQIGQLIKNLEGA
jgi:hypothetical protein